MAKEFLTRFGEGSNNGDPYGVDDIVIEGKGGVSNMVFAVEGSSESNHFQLKPNEVIFAKGVTASNFTGDGSSITNINGNSIQTGTIADDKLAADSVTTAKIADSNVTTAKIADSNVTTEKIADSNVTTAKIADSSVTTAKIADSSVTTAKIADSSVTTAKLDSNIDIDGNFSVANGNVGIGTTTPSAKLHVTGGDSVLENLSILNDMTLRGGNTINYRLKFDESTNKLLIGSGTDNVDLKPVATEEYVTTIVGDIASNVTANASFDQVDQSIVPSANGEYDLGSPDKQWQNLYLSGNQIRFGGGIVINSHDWSYLINYVVPPKSTTIESSMRKLFKGSAQDHSAYIKNKEVWTFGRNDLGQLGLGDYDNRAQPTRVPGITNAKAVAVGESFTVILKEDGTAVAFGVNTNGQLGDGTTNSTNTPVDVVGITNATAVSIGRRHTLFLLATGEVVGFGSNSRGQLGDSTTIMTNTSPVTMNLPDFTEDETLKARFIATGAYHSVVLLENGAAYVCGDNTYSQLGANGTDVLSANIPGVVPGVSNVVYAGCGENHTILIRYNGEVLTCGDNRKGQLGIGNKNAVTTFQSIIPAVGESDPDAGLLMEADGGADHTVVLKSDASVVLFGSNQFGQLGMGSAVTEKLLPTTLSYVAYSAAAGRNHTFLLLKKTRTNPDTIVAFGDNTFGQMGDADATITTRWIPNVIYESIYAKIFGTAFGYNTSIIDTDSTLFMCGKNNYGQARGDGSTSNREKFLVPVVLPDPSVRIVQVANGWEHTVALDTMGQVYAWGRNPYGQLGDGTTTNKSVPVNVSSYGSLSGKIVVAIVCGSSYTVALDSTGQVHAWGNNGQGQLGRNNTSYSTVPVNVSSYGSLSGKIVVAIACGTEYTVALDSTGQVHAWGYNYYGQLGRNNTANSTVPVAVSRVDGTSSLHGKIVVAIACGTQHTVALDIAGQVHAWGRNAEGQLGDGTTTNRNVPVAVSRVDGTSSLYDKPVVAMACGYYHTVALDNVGQVHIWGDNEHGQLGNGTTTDSSVPVAVSRLADASSLSGKTVVAISSGRDHIVALDDMGNVHAWGGNIEGQLGDGTTTSRSVPGLMDKTVFTGHNKVSSEGSFSQHKLFISDKPLELRAVGTNTYGQLGDSTTIDRLSAISLSFPKDVISSATGVNHSACVLSDGSLYTWGRNNNSQCGFNNGGANVTQPTKIFGITTAKSVVCGADFTLVILDDKSVLAFGLNDVGQLGLDASVTTAFDPTTVDGLTDVVKLAAGANFAVALDVNGHIKTWGSNAVGATGHGTDEGSTFGATAIVLSEKVVDVAAGENHLVLAMESGLVMTCGLNDKGQLGRSDNFETGAANSVLTYTEGLGTYTRAIIVAAGNAHTVVLLNNGCMRTFGNNADGQLASFAGVAQWEPVDPNVNTARAISTALDTTYYEEYYNDSTSTVFGFGKYKTYVTKSIGFASSTLTYTVGGSTRYPSYGMHNNDHALAIAGGQVYAQGQNWNGQIGNRSNSDRLTPTNVSPYGTLTEDGKTKTVVAIACGYGHTLAVDSTGQVHAWGRNDKGQLGDGTTTNKNEPVAVSIDAGTSSLHGKTVVAIAGGFFHSVALDSMGHVHTWGDGGRLGTGDTVDSHVPVEVSRDPITSSLYDKKVVAIACSSGLTFALDSTGQLHAWGYNGSGQLGDGTTSDRLTPTNISSYGTLNGRRIVTMACSSEHTVALDSTGQVHAWGSNRFGQLGNNSTTNRYLPGTVVYTNNIVNGNAIVALSCGYYSTFALDSAGYVYAWGRNTSGEQGINSTAERRMLSRAYTGSGTSFAGKRGVAIVCGGFFSFVMDSTGRVHSCGSNNYGQQGNGTRNLIYVPKLNNLSVGTNNNVGTNDFFINFTGQHRCFVDGITNIPSLMSSEGLIVVSDKNSYIDLLGSNSLITGKNAITVNNSLPMLSFSRKAKDKRVFGVVSVKANDESAPFGSSDLVKLAEKGDIRAQINSVGEGAMWVSDANGPIEAGDYITSSDLRGYGMKQDEGWVMNYTVAKATMDCDFEPAMVSAKEFILDVNGNLVIDPETGRPTWKVAMEPTEVTDENGEITMTGDLVESQEPEYIVKYMNYDVETDVITRITKEEYDQAKADGSSAVYRVALIGCTYHCG